MKIKNGYGLCNWPGSFKKRLEQVKKHLKRRSYEANTVYKQNKTVA